MDLRTPIHLGGDHYLEGVTVGGDPDARTVRDCPTCGSYTYDDDFHLVAIVFDGASGDRERYHFCGDDCLTAWLRIFPAT